VAKGEARQYLLVSKVFARSSGNSYGFSKMDVLLICSVSPRTVDFALTEAGYTVVRILQQFPTIEKLAEDVEDKTGRNSGRRLLRTGCLCCAQQTGVHEMVVEALLNIIYLSEGRANTYTHKKTLLGRTPVSCE
jgi:hypothetical protein